MIMVIWLLLAVGCGWSQTPAPDTLKYEFWFDGKPAHIFWRDFNEWQDARFFVDGSDTIVLGDTVDVVFRKVWAVDASEFWIMLNDEDVKPIAAQRVAVLDADTNIVDADELWFGRTRKRRNTIDRFRITKLSSRVYRVQEEIRPGVFVNRGTHAGRPDDFLHGRAFRVDPDSLKKAARRRGKFGGRGRGVEPIGKIDKPIR